MSAHLEELPALLALPLDCRGPRVGPMAAPNLFPHQLIGDKQSCSTGRLSHLWADWALEGHSGRKTGSLSLKCHLLLSFLLVAVSAQSRDCVATSVSSPALLNSARSGVLPGAKTQPDGAPALAWL